MHHRIHAFTKPKRHVRLVQIQSEKTDTIRYFAKTALRPTFQVVNDRRSITTVNGNSGQLGPDEPCPSSHEYRPVFPRIHTL